LLRRSARGIWTPMTRKATNSGEHSRIPQSHGTSTTRKARRRTTKAMATCRNLTRQSTSSSADYPADGNRRLPVEKS
jgi:hypothetical protein